MPASTIEPLIGVDTGGTFTDLVLVQGSRILTHKTPSTPEDFSRAVLDGVRALREQAGLSGPCTLVHSSTVATNALLEGRGARVGLITTRGFRDVLEIGRQQRPSLYNLRARRPPPLIPRARRMELSERVAADGSVLAALDDAEVERVLERLQQAGVESIALCLLFSFLRPAHERRVARAARRRRIPISVSSELVPVFREYERTATTAVNAFVAPVMTEYLRRLEQRGRGHEIRRLRIVQSNGGSLSRGDASREAAHTLLSGPAAGLMGAVAMARGIHEGPGPLNLITFDMGGTSTDVSLVTDAPTLTTESVIAGHPVTLPMMDIHTVGAGGGSIARIDAGGALQVGPESAGADPGPACYGRGDLPTVTDANLVLGRIDPKHFLGGRMSIHPQRAETALTLLAAAMNTPLEQAARSVVRLVNAAMERAIRVVSIERGHDCRNFTLVCFGGAGGLHACELASALRIPRVMIPRHPGVLSAWGAVSSDVIKDYARTVMLPLHPSASARIDRTLRELTTRAHRELTAQGFEESEVVLAPSLDLRYQGQSYELTVPYGRDRGVVAERFHQAHLARYGHADADQPLEAVTVRLRATGPLSKPKLNPFAPASPTSPTRRRGGLALLERDELAPGARAAGPALILEPFATTYLPADWQAVPDPYGHLILTRISDQHPNPPGRSTTVRAT